MKINISRYIIRFYKRSAILIGILIPILCFHLIPSINILTSPLSRFGIEEDTRLIWVIFNQFMAFTLFKLGIESNESILIDFRRIILNTMLTISILCFSLSGFINMSFSITHLTLAGTFFITYIGYIFWYGIYCLNRKVTLLSFALVLICIISILPMFYFKISYGIFEVVFILSLSIWNYMMIYYHK